MLNDPIANAMSVINNAEQVRKSACTITPSSKLVEGALAILNEHSYIGAVEREQTAKGLVLRVNLIGNVNKCGAIKPRFSVTQQTFERFEKRFLPAKDFGVIIVSTSKGIMTHTDAKKKGIGGKLIAYCY